jgi:hypothetical protein
MTSTAAAPDREPLAGLVERRTYHNPDNGYCVLRVKGFRQVSRQPAICSDFWLTSRYD